MWWPPQSPYRWIFLQGRMMEENWRWSIAPQRLQYKKPTNGNYKPTVVNHQHMVAVTVIIQRNQFRTPTGRGNINVTPHRQSNCRRCFCRSPSSSRLHHQLYRHHHRTPLQADVELYFFVPKHFASLRLVEHMFTHLCWNNSNKFSDNHRTA